MEATRDYSRFTTSVTATHFVGDWLNQRLVFGIDRDWTENQYLVPRSPIADNFPFPNTSDGHITLTNLVSSRLSVDHSATANYQPNDMLSFGTSVGAQYNSRQSTRFEADGDEFASPIFTSLTNILDYDDPFHRVTENNSLGIFIQEVVGFNDRLFVTAAVRADDHSAFGGDFDFIYYPKASATWVLSEENFWNVDLVNSFRVRGAWGESGRQPDAFARVAQYQSVPGPDGSPAIRVADPGNENVGPETSSEIEAGFDIALMDDRISGEFTYFKQWVRDAILNLSLAPSDPYIGNVQANLGELQNWGWEAGFDFQVLDNDWVNFDLRLSGDHTMNRITRLSEEQSRANFQEG